MKCVDGNFREDHRLVSGVPERLTEQVIDKDSGIGFSRIILHGQPTSCLALLCRSGMTSLPLQSVVFCAMHCGGQVMCHWPKILEVRVKALNYDLSVAFRLIAILNHG
jgi:hypothetical protein